MLSRAELKNLLEYSTDSGIFTWKKAIGPRARLGKIAGNLSSDGYIRIGIKGKLYVAHRLAWIYCNGNIPNGLQIDHINRIRNDNRICNLRLATASEQCLNRAAWGKVKSSGIILVNNRYIARATVSKGKRIIIGRFSTQLEAENALQNFDYREFIKTKKSTVWCTSSTKIRGISKSGNGFIVRKTVRGVRQYLGYFNTIEEAKNALKECNIR